MVMGNNGIDDYKKCRQINDDFDCHAARAIRTMHIAQWSSSVASCEATRCRHWASARAVLPRRLPWSTILNETQKH
jgi:hypothetical protein